MTGVRWAESANRKNNHGIVTMHGGQEEAEQNEAEFMTERHGGIVMNNDNAETRRTVEICYRTHKTLVNQIVDWTDQDVWEFIKGEQIPYCKLYDQGFKRLGCIGCPLGNYASQKREFKRYPAYRKMYLDAFEDMLKARRALGKDDSTGWWTDKEAVMKWWTGGFVGVAKGQISIDDLEAAEWDM